MSPDAATSTPKTSAPPPSPPPVAFTKHVNAFAPGPSWPWGPTKDWFAELLPKPDMTEDACVQSCGRNDRCNCAVYDTGTRTYAVPSCTASGERNEEGEVRN